MDYIRALFLTILVDIVHVITLGQEHIELDRDHCIFLTVYVLCLNVELRSVERRFTGFLSIFKTDLIKNVSHQILNALP